MTTDAYRKAGVDIDAANTLIDRIKPMARSTFRKGVLGGLGSFGGLFELGNRYEDPILVSGTDGVGTKLLVAQALGEHSTIGIDLVAMCVNDIVVLGAEPLFFLDYFATGKLEVDCAEQVVSGIAEGCRQAGCALLGGETAEMPGMYEPGHYDLAGFAVGVVEKSKLLTGESAQAGDVLIGLAASGLHSNGFSLVRKIVDETPGVDWDTHVAELGGALGEVCLTPTRIYVPDVLKALSVDGLRSAAHITGGGLVENIPRALPQHLGAVIDPASWQPLPVYEWLQNNGKISHSDMLSTFNMGIGMVLVVSAEHATAMTEAVGGQVLGRIVEDAQHQVSVAS
jgi:phosphoribosylformylglycinamidine cyclo-ligase